MKMMSKAGVLLGALLLMLSLVSCESLFTTNLFGELDKLDLSQLSDRELAGAILDDPSVVDSYTEAQVDALVVDLLAVTADTSQSDNTRMQAAAAASTAEMAASGADETLNNLGDMATDLVDGSLVVDSPDDILSAIFSDEGGNPLSASQIEDQIEAMLDAAAALDAYGDVLGSGDPPPGVSADELGLTALVTGIISVTGETAGDLATAIATEDFTGITFPNMDDVANDPVGELFPANPGLGNTIEGSPMISSLLDLFSA